MSGMGQDEFEQRLRYGSRAASMADTAMGESPVPGMSEGDLRTLRERNEAEGVVAPMTGESKETAIPLPVGAIVPVDDPANIVIDYKGEIDGGGIKASMFTNYVLKPMLSLVPKALLWGVGRALSYGAEKYAPNNWRRGMNWSEPASALLRHFTAWLEGEDYDSDSGLHHLDSVGANLAFLMHMVADERYKHLDDRP